MIRYIDEEKSAVMSGSSFIPRDHRLWSELGIDAAEAAGDIAPF